MNRSAGKAAADKTADKAAGNGEAAAGAAKVAGDGGVATAPPKTAGRKPAEPAAAEPPAAASAAPPTEPPARHARRLPGRAQARGPSRESARRASATTRSRPHNRSSGPFRGRRFPVPALAGPGHRVPVCHRAACRHDRAGPPPGKAAHPVRVCRGPLRVAGRESRPAVVSAAAARTAGVGSVPRPPGFSRPSRGRWASRATWRRCRRVRPSRWRAQARPQEQAAETPGIRLDAGPGGRRHSAAARQR
ncbi:hypothetical protein MHEC_33220 [Mycobacterium heckeshornense]|uniref:Uncharacterized protein n=1 Tax=Mycobacterium heckeshornense TaxID=110505 RepID=A0A7R7GVK1_9MYCO|nr:hypothetical protein MHEC_33220 [Mycobacterium heckeshornense]